MKENQQKQLIFIIINHNTDLPSLTTIQLQGCCDYIHRNMGYVVLESKLTGMKE